MKHSPAREWYRGEKATLLLHVAVIPRASTNEIVGPQGGRLKIRITAAPVDGKANERLIPLVAKAFAVPKTQIAILNGKSGRYKRISISSPNHLPDNLGILVGKNSH